MRLPSQTMHFIKFAFVGFLMFLVNIVALYVLREWDHVHYYIAVPAAFVLGSIVHYFIVRKYIFAGTERHVHEGLVYFLLLSLLDAAIVTIGVTFLVEEWYINLYVARTAMAAVGGIVNYFLNARYNFRIP